MHVRPRAVVVIDPAGGIDVAVLKDGDVHPVHREFHSEAGFTAWCAEFTLNLLPRSRVEVYVFNNMSLILADFYIRRLKFHVNHWNDMEWVERHLEHLTPAMLNMCTAAAPPELVDDGAVFTCGLVRLLFDQPTDALVFAPPVEDALAQLHIAPA